MSSVEQQQHTFEIVAEAFRFIAITKTLDDLLQSHMEEGSVSLPNYILKILCCRLTLPICQYVVIIFVVDIFFGPHASDSVQ
jgi:hypothetical protein